MKRLRQAGPLRALAATAYVLCIVVGSWCDVAFGAPPIRLQRIGTAELEGLAAFAADIDQDGIDELVVVGEQAVLALDQRDGAPRGSWPLPPERQGAYGIAMGYYDAAARVLVFRSSLRLAGNRLGFASNSAGAGLQWDAEPFYPACPGEVWQGPEPAQSLVQNGERLAWLACGTTGTAGSAEGERRVTWRGALSPTQRLVVKATWCGNQACAPTVTWGPFPHVGQAYAVWPRGTATYVVTAADAPRGTGGDRLSVWTAAAITPKSKPVAVEPFVGDIISVLVVQTGPKTSPRCLVVVRLPGAGRLDLWELVW